MIFDSHSEWANNFESILCWNMWVNILEMKWIMWSGFQRSWNLQIYHVPYRFLREIILQLQGVYLGGRHWFVNILHFFSFSWIMYFTFYLEKKRPNTNEENSLGDPACLNTSVAVFSKIYIMITSKLLAEMFQSCRLSNKTSYKFYIFPPHRYWTKNNNKASCHRNWLLPQFYEGPLKISLPPDIRKQYREYDTHIPKR